MTEWKTVTLSDLGEIVGGATPATSRDDYYNGDIPWLTPKDLAGYSGRYISRGARNITQNGLNSCSARLLPKNTVLFSSRAPIGYIAIAENDICTNQGFKSIVPNAQVSPLFLYYLLKYYKNEIEAMGSGTTFKEVSGSTMRNIKVRIPVLLNIQQRIADVLDALDTKIELNQKINDNLQKQLHMFYMKMFAESAMDAVLGNVVVTTSGGTPSRKHGEYYDHGSICWVKSKELCGDYLHDTEEHINELAIAKSSAKLLPSHSVLIAMYGATVGAYGIISQPMACNQAVCALLSNEKYPYTYLFQVACESQQILTNLAVGSAQQNISQVLIKQLPVHSNENIIQKFHSLAHPIHEKLETLQAENRQLWEMRDCLLPRLMSGELDVSTLDL